MSDLPPGWEWATVGEVAHVQLGRQRSPRNHSGPYMRPYLRAANVTWKGLDLQDVKDMNFTPEEAETFELQAGDILLNEASGSQNEVGKPAIWRSEIPGCCFQNTLLRVRSSRVQTEYLHWYFHHTAREGRFGEAGRGVNIRHLGKHGLASFRIPVAPLAEQERIVAAIEEHLSRLAAAEAMAASVTKRFDLLAYRLIDEMMSDIQKTVPLANFAAPNGITDGPFGSKLKSSHYTQDGPRVIRLENVGHGEFIDIRTHITQSHFADLNKHELAAGDLVVASLISNGLRACVIPPSVGPAIVKADCIRIRPSAHTDARFLNYALRRTSLKDFVSERVRGVGRSRLGLKNVASLPVPDVSPADQQRIADVLDDRLMRLQRSRASVDRVTGRSPLLRRAILAAAFSGELVPQDPDDEPASVLLERIRGERAAAAPKRRTRKRKAAPS